MSVWSEARAEFLLALGFMTRLPVTAEYSAQRMARSAAWYPATGIVIGVISGVVWLIGFWLFTSVLAVLFSMAASILLTGALHEDGFADCCDGLGGGKTREQALDIMRDSRIGAYGFIGLAMLLAIKAASLVALPAVFWVLLAGHATSRASMVVVIATSHYARSEGAGRALAGQMDVRGMQLAVALGAASLIPLLLVLPVGFVFFGVFGLALAHVVMRTVFESKLGGYTGDCLGAVQQVGEVGFYLGLLLCL